MVGGFDEDVADAPSVLHPGLLESLAADLAALNYTVGGVADFVGQEAYAALNRDQLVPVLLACEEELRAAAPSPLVVPILLWLVGGTLTQDQLDLAFPITGAHGLQALRLIEPVDAPAPDALRRAAVELRPYSSDADGDLWVASDLGALQRPGVLRHDHVLGIGGASLTLAQITVRPRVRTALDLGTGCGIQTFHLLSHAEHVTATDISPRALAFTRFNLLLNAGPLGIDPGALDARVSLRLGSLLEPVAGQRFDLVVSNPPFVITPRSTEESPEDQFTYRDGGLPGDDIVSGLLADLPGVLVEGGTAQLLGNWEIPAGREWDERLREWLPEGTDAWIIQREVQSPLQYAETWLRDAAENRDRAAYVRRYADYLGDFASRAVDSVGFGYIWLRRAPGRAPAWVRCEEITHEVEQPLGPHLGAAIERGDWLASAAPGGAGTALDQGGPHQEGPNDNAPDDNAPDQHAPGRDLNWEYLLVAGDVTEERHQRPGAEHPGVILLRQGAGLRRTTLLSTELAGFVSACDGDLTAGQIAGALAVLLGEDGPDFVPDLLAMAGRLVLEGFLIPAP
ncbi:SAM-dependent methyltransferase [Arthrobacter frigidicola]|nr:SAM-dependent methyltransferase [Arthrobacter frigidicola]